MGQLWARSEPSRASASRTPRAATSSSGRSRARPTASATTRSCKESKGLLKRVKDAIGERVLEVRVSTRLADSPACLVLGEHDLGAGMRRILAAAGPEAFRSRSRCSSSMSAIRWCSISTALADAAALQGAGAAPLRAGGAGRRRPARQSGRIRAAPEPAARGACRAAHSGVMKPPRAERVEDRRPRRGDRGAGRDAGRAAPATPRRRLALASCAIRIRSTAVRSTTRSSTRWRGPSWSSASRPSASTSAASAPAPGSTTRGAARPRMRWP